MTSKWPEVIRFIEMSLLLLVIIQANHAYRQDADGWSPIDHAKCFISACVGCLPPTVSRCTWHILKSPEKQKVFFLHKPKKMSPYPLEPLSLKYVDNTSTMAMSPTAKTWLSEVADLEWLRIGRAMSWRTWFLQIVREWRSQCQGEWQWKTQRQSLGKRAVDVWWFLQHKWTFFLTPQLEHLVVSSSSFWTYNCFCFAACRCFFLT